GPAGSLLLSCSIAKGWVARASGTTTRAEHPGTAVRWDTEIFEVVEVSAASDQGVRYRLEPWDSRHAIRVVETYDGAAEQSRDLEQERRRNAVRLRPLSWLLAPLLGHLPGAVQERMEGDFGAPARAMTILSALPLFVLGAYSFFASRFRLEFLLLGGDSPLVVWMAYHPGLSFYIAVESGVRLAVTVAQGHPMGSLAGVIAYEVWLRLRHRKAPAPPGAAAGRPRWKTSDSFRMLEPLLSLLTPAEQEALERRFDFDCLKWGRRGAWLLLILAVLNLAISAGALAQGRAGFWDLFWLAAGAYLAGEQIARLGKLRRGKPAGSILAAVVRPLAGRLGMLG
ncbi:MAG TPA: hypothetical protein VKJ00_15420, partial [Thermoanaerobaculia bacterium]|nr:hypothetical protein [Thermoanaerobaculia bacterium]